MASLLLALVLMGLCACGTTQVQPGPLVSRSAVAAAGCLRIVDARTRDTYNAVVLSKTTAQAWLKDAVTHWYSGRVRVVEYANAPTLRLEQAYVKHSHGLTFEVVILSWVRDGQQPQTVRGVAETPMFESVESGLHRLSKRR
ncbi:MAG: hypothetical protein HC809_14985 [Gammaproteobacteria bacterium]|nr:hypothetical protein [Gammaproteobacteria bacterium]